MACIGPRRKRLKPIPAACEPVTFGSDFLSTRVGDTAVLFGKRPMTYYIFDSCLRNQYAG
jgi:hypothetical protein